mmetsp:Transcript_35969/g.143807  ORF Transcript_35969/g.143807 Transcript_35969/m.143807 type:complete len:569 (-) Transcript_35969:2244-3950(-)
MDDLKVASEDGDNAVLLEPESLMADSSLAADSKKSTGIQSISRILTGLNPNKKKTGLNATSAGTLLERTDEQVQPHISPESRQPASLPDLNHLQTDNADDEDELTRFYSVAEDSVRRALSNPGPQSSSSRAALSTQFTTRRVNYLLLSRPVVPPEAKDLEAGDSEDQDLLERTDMLSKFRVVSRVSKVGKQAGKQVNKGRRRKKKVKDGVVVFKGHPSWSIVLAFQVGLRQTSELLNSDSKPPELNGQDSKVSVVFELRAAASGGETEVSRTTWAHHAPYLYKEIRETFGISDGEFLGSVSSEAKIRELPTPGRSGALFYITEDEEYFIKTISQDEEKKLKLMLPGYVKHIKRYPNTLLTKFVASFYIKTAQRHHIRLVAMGSIFRGGLYIDRKYDLKGSVINRRASEKEKLKDFVTLKDLDMEPLYFVPEVLDRILAIIERDSEFLEQEGIMDYSLLLGLSEVMPGERTHEDVYGEDEKAAPWVFGYQKYVGQDGERFVTHRICLGIIDILQPYTKRKQVEFVGKVCRHCSSGVSPSLQFFFQSPERSTVKIQRVLLTSEQHLNASR